MRYQPQSTHKKFTKHLLLCGLALGLAIANAGAQNHLMPTGPGGGKPDDGKQPFDPHPTAPGSLTKNILTYGADKDGNQIPLKTIRITNDTAGTIYPIMRDPNTGAKTDQFGYISIYDPYDLPDKEYRGYIGYKGDDGQYYFGLKPNQSVLVNVPLVFWNGGRISIGTDGEYLTPQKPPNPYNYDKDAERSITDAEKSSDTITNGAIMWYRAAKVIDFSDDNANGLAEFTFRDHDYLVKVKVNGQINEAIPDGQLLDLINYDISNVDTLYLPMAIAALDATVITGGGPLPLRTNYKKGSVPDVYGYTGSLMGVDELQEKLRDFTAPNNKILGQYFGGKGWPYYNMPSPGNNTQAPIKIPSGANIFPQSPLKGVMWSFQDGTWQSNKYLLSSGGNEAVSVGIGLAGADVNNKDPNPAGVTVVQLAQGTSKDTLSFVQKGFLVSDSNPVGTIVASGTTVLGMDVANQKVTLSKPTTGPGVGPGPVGKRPTRSFEFARPLDDYVVDRMVNLWYSWAQYYIEHWKDQNQLAPTAPVQIHGSIAAETAILSFQEAHPELVRGMTISGPGLDNTYGESGPNQGKAIILEISSDKKSVIASRVANATSSGPYTFAPPQELLWTPKKEGDTGYPLIGDKFQFTTPPPDWQNPYEFSQNVYLIMAYMNQIDKVNNSDLLKFMQDVIGGNMPYALDEAGKDSDDGKMVIAMVRDRIKAALRGVSDFTKYPDKLSPDGKTHLVWYPDPSLPTGGQPYNVFNLDPFVRFVHVNLGFSGYGFSLDDDTADIGAAGASHLQLSIGGPGGLKKLSPSTSQTPFGPFTASGTYVITPGASSPSNFAKVVDQTPIRINTIGVHNLKNDAIVVIAGVQGDTAANGTFKIGNVAPTSFDLFDEKTGDPIKPNGVTPTPPKGQPAGNWSLPKAPYIDTGSDLSKVFYRVNVNDPQGVFQGAVVSVEGQSMDRENKIRLRSFGQQITGRLILTEKLKYADGTDVPAGTYNFHYSSD